MAIIADVVVVVLPSTVVERDKWNDPPPPPPLLPSLLPTPPPPPPPPPDLDSVFGVRNGVSTYSFASRSFSGLGAASVTGVNGDSILLLMLLFILLL